MLDFFLFSIGSNGKLKLEQELKGVYLMGQEVRKNLSEASQEVRIELLLITIVICWYSIKIQNV